MLKERNAPVTVRFEKEQIQKLLIERARIDRSINWIIRESVKRYFIGVETELDIIKFRKNKMK